MKLRKFVATAAFGCAVGAAVLGAGSAQADPPGPPGPPWVPGPGVNVGGPGNPLPPGQGYQPPPGHRGDIDGIVPVWAPPPPRPPAWAPWLPVVWNADVAGWGVWWNGGFVRL